MPVRRIVTGIDATGRSVIVSDGPTPAHVDFGSAQLDELWIKDSAPPDPTDPTDPVLTKEIVLEPPPGGSNFRIVTFLPESASDQPAPRETTEAAAKFDSEGAMEDDAHGFHATPTTDYLIILSGEVDLLMDDGAVRLTPGDCVVQRETRHGWRNPGPEPCVMAAVLISSRSPAQGS